MNKEIYVSPKNFSSLVSESFKGCTPDNSTATGIESEMPAGINRSLRCHDGEGGFITYYEDPSVSD